jgi:cell division protein FtsZ
MSHKGTALMGIGIAAGKDRAAEAAQKALNSPILETSINGAQGVIMNITGGNNLTLYEIQEAADIVASASHEELNMIFGSVINENLKEEIIVTVIATGFNEEDLALEKSSEPSNDEISIPYQREQRKKYIQPDLINRVEPINDFEQQLDLQDKSLDTPSFMRKRKKRFWLT